ncbi:MAG: DUF4172 domain-containing protein [Sulfurimicrobium sp.]|nr:DUF4172 domain-containing protein [Sulfurimicrobium sp.]
MAHDLRMNSGYCTYVWQASDWPNWHYDLASLAGPLAEVSRAQGMLLGRLADVGMALRDQASLVALTEDVIKTSEIEGERLDAESVRSSTRLHPIPRAPSSGLGCWAEQRLHGLPPTRSESYMEIIHFNPDYPLECTRM